MHYHRSVMRSAYISKSPRLSSESVCIWEASRNHTIAGDIRKVILRLNAEKYMLPSQAASHWASNLPKG